MLPFCITHAPSPSAYSSIYQHILSLSNKHQCFLYWLYINSLQIPSCNIARQKRKLMTQYERTKPFQTLLNHHVQVQHSIPGILFGGLWGCLKMICKQGCTVCSQFHYAVFVLANWPVSKWEHLQQEKKNPRQHVGPGPRPEGFNLFDGCIWCVLSQSYLHKPHQYALQLT